MINYFAFGSNLSSPRLLQRLPNVRVSCVATLNRHQLCWRKNDHGQSGKCDIEFTDDPTHQVFGVIYQMTHDEQRQLDRYESEGFGYQRKIVEVLTVGGEAIEAFTYYALDILEGQRPFHWYKEHVLRGALEHEFPAEYVDGIRATESIDDHDPLRVQKELAIYADL